MFSGGIPLTPWGMAFFAAVTFTLLGSFPVFHAKTTKGFKQPSKRRTVAVFFIVMSMLSWGTYSVLSLPRWEARYLLFQAGNTLPSNYSSGNVFTRHICGELGFAARGGFTSGEMALTELSGAQFEDRLVDIQNIAARLEEDDYVIVNWFLSSPNSETQWINATFARGSVDLSARFTGSGVSFSVNPTDCESNRDESFRLAFIDELTIEQICSLETTPSPFPLACETG